MLLYSINAYSQNTTADSCTAPIDSITRRPVFLVVDIPAEVDGGSSALFQAITKRLKTPPKAGRLGVDTKIFVGFVVDEYGKMTGQRIIKNIEGTNMAEQVLK